MVCPVFCAARATAVNPSLPPLRLLALLVLPLLALPLLALLQQPQPVPLPVQPASLVCFKVFSVAPLLQLLRVAELAPIRSKPATACRVLPNNWG